MIKHVVIYSLVAFVIFLPFTLWAQEIQVSGVTMSLSDLSAEINPCFDLNGDTCAMVKIRTNNLGGLDFPNKSQYVKKENAPDGVYELFVPAICRRIDFIHPNFLPGQIDFGEYGYRRLKPGKTYLVTLIAKERKTLGSSIVFKIEPPTAKLTVDNEQRIVEGGVVELKLTSGMHAYTVRADNCQFVNGYINIGESETQVKTIVLQPIMHEVKVECNVSNARVFIDNIDYGKVGNKMLPQGNHKISIRAKGHIDKDEHINITSLTRRLHYELAENKQTVHINPVTVYVFSNGMELFINGKKVKDWSAGSAVSLIPGDYYMFQLENGKTEKLYIDRSDDGRSIYLSDYNPNAPRNSEKDVRLNYNVQNGRGVNNYMDNSMYRNTSSPQRSSGGSTTYNTRNGRGVNNHQNNSTHRNTSSPRRSGESYYNRNRAIPPSGQRFNTPGRQH